MVTERHPQHTPGREDPRLLVNIFSETEPVNTECNCGANSGEHYRDCPFNVANVRESRAKPAMLGPQCRKCDGKGHYCVNLPLEGAPPDNRRHCEICGGRGYERIKRNPFPDNSKVMTSLERDAACDLLRTIIQQHIKSPFDERNRVQVMIEESLQRIAAKQ